VDPARTGRKSGPRKWLGTVAGKSAAGFGAVLLAVVTTWVVRYLGAPDRPTAKEPTTTLSIRPVTRSSGWSTGGSTTKNDYLSVTAIMDPSDACESGQPGWVFPVPPARLPLPPDDPKQRSVWAQDNGGIPQSGSNLTLDVQALQGHAIFVKRLGIKVTSRKPPPNGTAPYPGSCGGVLPALFAIDLDKPEADPTPISGWNEAQQQVPPVPFPHHLHAGDVEEWSIALSTKTCTCDYVATIDWSADNGQQGQLEIRNNGKPWTVAAIEGSKLASRGEGQWQAY
jgi:hypothetical protein